MIQQNNHRYVLGIGIAVALGFTVFFFHTIVFHLDVPIRLQDDVAYGYFLFDTNVRHIATADWGHIFESRMLYPVTGTMTLGNSLLGQSIIGFPIYILTHDVITAANAVTVLNYVLTFLFMYLFAYTLTKHWQGSLLAGLVFSFNPYMLSRMHQELTVFQWIPLLFLVAEKLLHRISWRWIFVGVVACILCLLSSFYYIYIVLFSVTLYVFIRCVVDKVPLKHFLHPATVVGVLCLMGASIFYLKPFVETKRQYAIERSVAFAAQYSVRLSDFVTVDPANKTWGPILSSRPTNWYEHSLFIGVLGPVLFGITLVLLFCKKGKRELGRRVGIWLILGLISLLLSLGPFISMGSLQIPSLYMALYRFVPFTDTLRSPARFYIITLFSLGIVIAYGWSWMERRMKKAVRLFCFICLMAGIMVEYRYDFKTPVPVNPAIISLYRRLDTLPTVRVILELPMGNGYTFGNPFVNRDHMEDAVYLLFALYHSKYLVNGYHADVPPQYSALGRMVDSNFPTPTKLSYLRRMGVSTIIVHVSEYNQRGLGISTIEGLRLLGVKELTGTEDIRVFQITQ